MSGVFSGCYFNVSEEESFNSWTEGEVLRVIDGDTIEPQNGDIIRYLGINTPELTIDFWFL